MSRDPEEYDPGSLNLYEYVNSCPITWVDPSGLVIAPGAEDYAKANCKADCFDLVGAQLCGLAKPRLEQIRDEATREAMKTVKSGVEHHQLRHCIASGWLARAFGCACAQCLGLQRELAQEDVGGQDPTATIWMNYANGQGRACAGCSGKNNRRNPPSVVVNPREGETYPDYASKESIVSCCRFALMAGLLDPPVGEPHPRPSDQEYPRRNR